MLALNLFFVLCVLYAETTAKSPLCSSDGLKYPSLTKCNEYMICENGDLKTIQCSPIEYHYNCRTKTCENITHCCASVTTTVSESVTTKTSSSLPADSNSTPSSVFDTSTTSTSLSTSNLNSSSTSVTDITNTTIIVPGTFTVSTSTTIKGNPSDTPDKTSSAEPGTNSTPLPSTTIKGNPSDTPDKSSSPEPGTDSTPLPSTTIKGNPSDTPDNSSSPAPGTNSTPLKSTTIKGNPSDTPDNSSSPEPGTNSTPLPSTTIKGHPSDTSDNSTSSKSGTDSTSSPSTTIEGNPSDTPDYSSSPSSETGVTPATLTVPGTITENPNDTPNTTEPVDCDSNHNKYPYPGDCHSYNQCENGKLKKKKCSLGRSFDCFSKECRFIAFTPCCNSSSPSGNGEFCLINGLKVPNVFTNNKYFKCIDHKVVEKTCLDGERYDWLRAKCVEKQPGTTNPNPSTGPPDPSDNPNTPEPVECDSSHDKYPYPGDCHSYNQCEDGKLKKKKCSLGRSFDCFSKECRFIAFTPCCNSSSPSGNGEFCLINGLKVPNVFTNNKYFECVDHKVVEKTCLDGERYDWLRAKCVEKQPGTTNPNPSTGPPDPSDNPNTPEPVECDSSHDKYPYPGDCHSYNQCEDGKLKKKKCSLGRSFDCFSKECRFIAFTPCCNSSSPSGNGEFCLINGLKVPNVFTNNKYFECVDHKVVEKTCLDGERYDWLRAKCVEKQPGTTNPNPSTGPPDPSDNPNTPEPVECDSSHDKYPYPGDCHSYNQCEDGKLKKKKCSLGRSFDCFSKECRLIAFTPCCNSSSPSGNGEFCLINGLKVPNVFTNNKYFECVDHKVVEKACLDGERYDWLRAKCVEKQPGTTNPNPSTGPPDPSDNPNTPEPVECDSSHDKYPYPGDCHSYNQCEDGKLKKKKCSFGRSYDCFSKECRFFAFTPCCKNNTTTNDTHCLINGIKVPNIFTNNKYFECVDHKIEEKTCLDGERYNWLRAKCVEKQSGTTNPNPSTDPSTSLCTKDGLTYPNTAECRSYFTCEGGQLVKQTCAVGLVWNCFTKSCQPKFFSPCCKDDPNPPPGSSSSCLNLNIKIPNPFTCDQYFECQNYTIIEKKCLSGERYDWLLMKCVEAKSGRCASPTTITTIPGPSRCSEGSKFSDIYDSHSYYECVDGKVEKKTCPLNLSYNCWLKICALNIAITHCYQTNISDSGQEVSCGRIDSKIPDPYNCTNYYECSFFRTKYKSCAENEYFDVYTLSCKSQSDAVCIIDINESNSTTPELPASPTTTTTIQGPSKCSEGSKFSDIYDSHSYYECIDGKVEKKTCPLNLSYNCWLKICALNIAITHCSQTNISDSGKEVSCGRIDSKIPDPYNCTNYYECSFFRTKYKSCAENEYFDVYTLSCKPQNDAVCIIDINESNSTTPELPPTLTPSPLCTQAGLKFPDATNCKKYLECDSNGQLIKKSCILGFVFNCFTQSCNLNIFSPCCSDDPNNSHYNNNSFCLINDKKIPDFFNCNKYYKCEKHAIQHEACSNGQIYKWTSGNCEEGTKRDCAVLPGRNDTTEVTVPGTTVRSTNNVTTPPITTVKSPNTTPPSPLCPRDGIKYPSTTPGECDGYFICINRQMVKKHCTTGQVYNCKIKECEFQLNPHCCSGGGPVPV